MRTFLLLFLVANLGFAMEMNQQKEYSDLVFEKLSLNKDAPFNIYKATFEKGKKFALSQNPKKFLLVETLADGSKRLIEVDPLTNRLKEEKIIIEDDETLIFKNAKTEPNKDSSNIDTERNKTIISNRERKVLFKDADNQEKNEFYLNKEKIILHGIKNNFLKNVKRNISSYNKKIGIAHTISIGDKNLIFFHPEEKVQTIGISDSLGKILMKLNFSMAASDRGQVTIFRNGNFAVLDRDPEHAKFILYFGENKFPVSKCRKTIIKALYNSNDLAKVNDDNFSWVVFQKLLISPKTKNGYEPRERDIERFKGRILYAVHEWIREKFDRVTWFKMINKKKMFEPVPSEIKAEKLISLEDKAALFNAVYKRDLAEIDNLIAKGLSLSELRNEQGQTPAEYARSREQLIFALALENNLAWYIFNRPQLKIECDKYSDIAFHQAPAIEPFNNDSFEFYEAITNKNLMLSLDPQGPFFVQSHQSRYNWLKLDFDKNLLIDTGEGFTAQQDELKDIALFGSDLQFKKAIKYVFPEGEEKEIIRRKIIFQDRYLIFYKDAFIGISDSEQNMLALFKISKPINCIYDDIAIFENGDFAILVHNEDDQTIYYGKNKRPILATCQSIIDARIQKNPITEKFSWEIFKTLRSARNHRPNAEGQKSGIGLAYYFVGTNLFPLFSLAAHLNKDFWMTCIAQKKLLRPAPENVPVENSKLFIAIELNKLFTVLENKILFKAIRTCDIWQINALIKRANKEGRSLSKIMFGNQTPSGYAQQKNYKSLSMALIDGSIWNVVDKKKLYQKCKEEMAAAQKNLAQLNNSKEITVQYSIKLQEDCQSIMDEFISGTLDLLDSDIFSSEAIQNFLNDHDLQSWDLSIFNGTIFHHIGKVALKWEDERWSAINIRRLFDFTKDVIPTELWENYLSPKSIKNWSCTDTIHPKNEAITEKDIKNFFDAVDKCNFDQIDLLLKKGIYLNTLKNNAGLSPSEIALAKNQVIFAFALEDNLNWHIVDKEKLKEECNFIK